VGGEERRGGGGGGGGRRRRAHIYIKSEERGKEAERKEKKGMNYWLVFIRAFLCAACGYAVRCACLVSVSLFPQRPDYAKNKILKKKPMKGEKKTKQTTKKRERRGENEPKKRTIWENISKFKKKKKKKRKEIKRCGWTLGRTREREGARGKAHDGYNDTHIARGRMKKEKDESHSIKTN